MGVFDYFRKNDLLNCSFQYYLLSLLHFLFYYTTEKYHNPYIMLFLLFGILPVLDIILPTDDRNPTDEEYKKLVNQIRFKIPLFLSIITDWIVYWWALNKILLESNGIFFNIGLIASLAVFEGGNINICHELNHKTSFMHKLFGVTGLVKNFIPHFIIEHNYFHHVYVSTPQDTATSKLNQPIIPFIIGSFKGSFQHSWAIENKRCIESYGTKYHYKNFMIYSTLSCLLWPLSGYYLYGMEGALIQIIVGFTSSSFLEIINYVEHYGLRRRFIAPLGKYENVTILHSWNAPFRISNYLLVKLQRHSDHHENALKPYQVLSSYPESPSLPQGYAVCLIIALIPSIWFEVMNPLVDLVKKGEKPSKELLEKINKTIYHYVFRVNLITFMLLVVANFTKPY